MTCKGCTNRHECCHATCEIYKSELEKKREARRKKIADTMVDAYTVQSVNKRKYEWMRKNKC